MVGVQQQSRFLRWLQLGLALWLSLALGSAWADPPGRVARVSELNGEAWLFDSETKEWLQLGRNHTVSEGDRLRTDPGSRMALRIGSTSLWVDERSDIEFSQLNDERVELRVDQGSLALRLRSPDSANDTQLRTREGRFVFEREGFYRVDQLDRGSRALNWQGRMRFESRAGDAQPVWLNSNEQVEFWWANGPRAERQRFDVDGFTDWALAQGRSDGDAISYRYVSPEMTGAEDLDRHGRWETAAEYGAVWIPTQVAPDWAPYRYGRWVWSRPWGWTWVDDAPWGFAPFHYGRWVHYRERWCWVPGRYVARPVYAPALVAWVGGGSVSVGISVGPRHNYPRYGWFPLAPREVYRPSYQHSPAYVRRLNPEADPVTVVNPSGSVNRPVYRNRDVAGAISTHVPRGDGVVRPAPWRDAQVPAVALPQATGRTELPPVPSATLPVRSGPVFDTPRQGRDERTPWRAPDQPARGGAEPAGRTQPMPAPLPAPVPGPVTLPSRDTGVPRSIIEREQQREQQREQVREQPREVFREPVREPERARQPERSWERPTPVPAVPQASPPAWPAQPQVQPPVQRDYGVPRSAIEREQQREVQREVQREMPREQAPQIREIQREPVRMPERNLERAPERSPERVQERSPDRGVPMRSAMPAAPPPPPAAAPISRTDERPQRRTGDDAPRRQDGRPQRNQD